MKNSKILAIDVTQKNRLDAEKYTNLFVAIYNSDNMAFCMEDLQNAMYLLPNELELALIRKFNLFELDEVFPNEVDSQMVSDALELLLSYDEGDTSYSVNSKIAYLQRSQSQVIFNDNLYSEWNVNINTLNISSRIKNALIRANIKTLNDLFFSRLCDLKSIRNLGEKSLKEILLLFEEYGVEPNTY